MTWLLDGNLLVALVIDTHVHHERAHRWFAHLGGNRFSTCLVTEGTLLRVHMQTAEDGSAAAAWNTLKEVCAHPAHEWWGNAFSYVDVPHCNLQGSAQITDAWLAELTRRREGKLATLDSALAILHAEVAELLPL